MQDKTITLPLRELHEHPLNPNTHDDQQVLEMKKSIQENGVYRLVVINKENVILAGHCLVSALRSLKIESVDCFVFEGTAEQEIKLMLSDNKLSRMSKNDVIKEMDLLSKVDIPAGYSLAEIAAVKTKGAQLVEKVKKRYTNEDAYDGEYTNKTMRLFRYHGSKFLMLEHITPLIVQAKETHRCDLFVELFCGSAIVMLHNHQLFSKKIINDIDDIIVNFYRVYKDKKKQRVLFDTLETMLHSRTLFNECLQKIESQQFESDIDMAVAFIYYQNCIVPNMERVFVSNADRRTNALTWKKDKKQLYELCDIFEDITIENKEALELLPLLDSKSTLFYCDPPYPDTAQKSYSGYDQDDFDDLIENLNGIQGKFILSCLYKNLENSRHVIETQNIQVFEKNIQYSSSTKIKYETLVTNF